MLKISHSMQSAKKNVHLFQKKDSGESQGVSKAELEVALKAMEGKRMSLSQQDNLYLVSMVVHSLG